MELERARTARATPHDHVASASEQVFVITHPEKVLFPDDGITKRELAEYYEMVAPVMLPHILGRPVTMERFHRGIGQKGFFQKNVVKGFPTWLERVEVAKKDGVVHHPVVRDVQGLLWLANQNCITAHVWTSRAPDVSLPDVCIIDLDPADDDGKRLGAAALLVRDVLAEYGLTSWVKTSGSKGFHIAVPLDSTASYGDVARFAHRFGATMVRRDPDNFTQEFYKADRGGRILVDTGRNEYSATFAAAYTVRARAGAPVSAPCTWDELEAGTVAPTSFTMRNMTERLDSVGDLWKGLLECRQAVKDIQIM